MFVRRFFLFLKIFKTYRQNPIKNQDIILFYLIEKNIACQINKGMPLQAWRPEKTEIRLMRFMIMIIKVKLKKKKNNTTI
jgi:hypothetical protein